MSLFHLLYTNEPASIPDDGLRIIKTGTIKMGREDHARAYYVKQHNPELILSVIAEKRRRAMKDNISLGIAA